MKRFAFSLLVAAIAAAGSAEAAQAQLLPDSYLTGVDCQNAFPAFTMTGFLASVQCSGAFSGSDIGADPGEEAVTRHIDTLWNFVTTTDGARLTDGMGLTGEFVLALRAPDAFSLFYFTGISSLDIDYSQVGAGVSVDGYFPETGENGSLYGVPEPGSMLLLGTGLLGMAMVRRRREDV